MTPRGLLARAAAFLLCHLLATVVLLLGLWGWLHREAIFGLEPAPAEMPGAAADLIPPSFVAPREPALGAPLEAAPASLQEPPPPVFRPLQPVPPALDPPSPAFEPLGAAAPSHAVEPAPAPVAPTGGDAAPPPPVAPAAPPQSLPGTLSSGSPPEPPSAGAPVLSAPAGKDEWLDAARAAARSADYPGAERHYRALWERFPDDPDPAGELADLYRRQGRTEDAAGAYIEAARRLVRSGQAARARALAARLQSWSPQTAGMIYALVPPPTWPGGPSQPAPSLYQSLGR